MPDSGNDPEVFIAFGFGLFLFFCMVILMWLVVDVYISGHSMR